MPPSREWWRQSSPITFPFDYEMRTSDFDFELPDRLIAQEPLKARDASRLLVLPRSEGPVQHRLFAELPALLAPGDLLVVNDVRVFPARLFGRKAGSGGRVEVLLLQALGECDWRAMAGASKPLREGMRIDFDRANEDLWARVIAVHGDGFISLRFEKKNEEVLELLEAGAGEVPLPPYIVRPQGAKSPVDDADRYQTIFAKRPGAVAAPTAGLHFTSEVLEALKAVGVGTAAITLHVGPGTFLPVRAENLDEHVMHSERFEVPEETALAVERTRSLGGRIIAVGTTSLRAMEASAIEGGRLRAGAGDTNLFVRPGYRVRVVDGLITNFHLPRSTLLMLVCALAGKERVLQAYREAVENDYRFYSYGDAMLLL